MSPGHIGGREKELCLATGIQVYEWLWQDCAGPETQLVDREYGSLAVGENGYPPVRVR
jgi:hypothetical protein